MARTYITSTGPGMSTPNVLITGASGYLGGTLLARWKSASLPPYGKLYALVRSEEQAQAVTRYGADPLWFSNDDQETITKTIAENDITIVFWLINSFEATVQLRVLEALAEVRHKSGHIVHFVHTSGGKLFSSHAGHPTDRVLRDTDEDMYEVQKSSQPSHPELVKALHANNIIIETAELLGVRGYIFVPTIVYGQGEGFGNQTSIQTVAVVKAAVQTHQVFRVDGGRPEWPVCHVVDNSTLYLQLLRKMITGEQLGHGKKGYYFAASGSLAWDDIYAAFATALCRRGLVDSKEIRFADRNALQRMGEALGCRTDEVPIQLGGKCAANAEHGKVIGWAPQHPPEHLLEIADNEVALILEKLTMPATK